MKVNFNVYAIYDKVAEEYGNPLIARNDGMILRLMIDQLAKLQNPQDYDLFQIGHYSVLTGEISGCMHRRISPGMVKGVEVSEKNVDNNDKEDLE